MQKLAIVLMLLVVTSFAGDADRPISNTNVETSNTGYVAPSPDRAVLWEKPYDGTCDLAYRSSGPTRAADDFILTSSGRLESLEWWSLYSTPPGPGADFNLRIYSDDGSKPGTQLWEVAAITPTNTDTGDDYFSGYDLYHTVVTLDSTDYLQLDAGITYWLSMYCSSDKFFWTSWGNGNMHSSVNGGAWERLNDDGMFRLNGTHTSAVEEASWGQIKADL